MPCQHSAQPDSRSLALHTCCLPVGKVVCTLLKICVQTLSEESKRQRQQTEKVQGLLSVSN